MAEVETTDITPSRSGRILAWVGVASLLVGGVIAANPYRMRERLIDSAAPTEAAVASSPPVWQPVVTLRGAGSGPASPFSISRDASQWRVRWTCQSGGLLVEAPARPLPILDVRCPGVGAGFARQAGDQHLQVTADGPWQLDVEQRMGGRADGAGGGDAAAPGSTVTTVPGPPRAAPRWETVSTFTGSGPMETPDFAILGQAIQWRVRWKCASGTIRITATPPPRRPGPMVDSTCPQHGEGYSVSTGPAHLKIEADATWEAVVDQQVDLALDEPPPAGLGAAPVLAGGEFYDVEKKGKGSARLYRLADGRRILRFENFEVSNNTDLFIWLTDAASPKTSAEASKAARTVLGNLKSTVGNQNYEVPADVPDSRLRSVVIWCEPVAIAYSAASLHG